MENKIKNSYQISKNVNISVNKEDSFSVSTYNQQLNDMLVFESVPTIGSYVEDISSLSSVETGSASSQIARNVIELLEKFYITLSAATSVLKTIFRLLKKSNKAIVIATGALILLNLLKPLNINITLPSQHLEYKNLKYDMSLGRVEFNYQRFNSN